jgi:hypothetical protein
MMFNNGMSTQLWKWTELVFMLKQRKSIFRKFLLLFCSDQVSQAWIKMFWSPGLNRRSCCFSYLYIGISATQVNLYVLWFLFIDNIQYLKHTVILLQEKLEILNIYIHRHFQILVEMSRGLIHFIGLGLWPLWHLP